MKESSNRHLVDPYGNPIPRKRSLSDKWKSYTKMVRYTIVGFTIFVAGLTTLLVNIDKMVSYIIPISSITVSSMVPVLLDESTGIDIVITNNKEHPVALLNCSIELFASVSMMNSLAKSSYFLSGSVDTSGSLVGDVITGDSSTMNSNAKYSLSGVIKAGDADWVAEFNFPLREEVDPLKSRSLIVYFPKTVEIISKKGMSSVGDIPNKYFTSDNRGELMLSEYLRERGKMKAVIKITDADGKESTINKILNF